MKIRKNKPANMNMLCDIHRKKKTERIFPRASALDDLVEARKLSFYPFLSATKRDFHVKTSKQLYCVLFPCSCVIMTNIILDAMKRNQPATICLKRASVHENRTYEYDQPHIRIPQS